MKRNPVCVKCQISYELIKSGGWVVEMFNRPPRPYKIWSADMWQCKKCGHQIMSGYGHSPIAEHYQSEFPMILESIQSHPEYVIYEYERLSDVE